MALHSPGVGWHLAQKSVQRHFQNGPSMGSAHHSQKKEAFSASDLEEAAEEFAENDLMSRFVGALHRPLSAATKAVIDRFRYA